MFAVIFEVVPKQELWNEYLDLAKLLKPELEKIDGFLRAVQRSRLGLGESEMQQADANRRRVAAQGIPATRFHVTPLLATYTAAWGCHGAVQFIC